MSTHGKDTELNYLHNIFRLRLRKLQVFLRGSDVHDCVNHAPSLLEASGRGFEENLVGDFARPREQVGYVFPNLAQRTSFKMTTL